MITPAEWNSELVDVDAYLERIGHPRAEPSAEALASLHEAHVRTFPFENIDVLLGTHAGLGLDVIGDKFLRHQRGGYCFEHALLFSAVLERLGFTVRRLVSRVQPDRPGPCTHMTLAVRADGVEHLADVGFGSGLLRPMPLRDGLVVDQAGWAHRLSFDGRWWTLSRRDGDGWQAQHSFDETPQRPVDYEVAHHYTGTHPKSPFTGQLVVIRLVPGSRTRFVGDTLSVDHPDGTSDVTRVTAEDIDKTLRQLDVVLDAESLNALKAGFAAQEAGKPAFG